MRRLVGLIASSAGPPSTTTPSLGSNPPRLFSTGAAQNKTMAASGSNPLLRLSPDTRLSPRCYNGSTSSLSSSWTSRSPFGLSRQPSVCSGQPLTVSFSKLLKIEFHHFNISVLSWPSKFIHFSRIEPIFTYDDFSSSFKAKLLFKPSWQPKSAQNTPKKTFHQHDFASCSTYAQTQSQLHWHGLPHHGHHHRVPTTFQGTSTPGPTHPTHFGTPTIKGFI